MSDPGPNIKFPDDAAKERIREYLGVDEIDVVNGSTFSLLRVRMGEVWREASVPYADLLGNSRETNAEKFAAIFVSLSREARDQIERLVRSMSLDKATGADLDRIAENVGMDPRADPEYREWRRNQESEPEMPLPAPPTNRFEAVVAEIIESVADPRDRVTSFSVEVRRRPSRGPTEWTVTCGVCGKDLSGRYDVVTVLNLKGNIPPQQFEQFRRQWARAVQSGTRPLVMNTEVERFDMGPELQVALEEHAKLCSRAEEQGQ